MKSKISNKPLLRLAIAATIEAFERRLLMSVYTVNTLSDAVNPPPGQLTLREAVAESTASYAPSTIDFDPTVFTNGSLHTITLTQGEIEFPYSTTTTIQGPGAGVLAISGGGQSRIFQVDPAASLNLSGMAITDGNATVADSQGNTYGGGILNYGLLTIDQSTITGNSVAASGQAVGRYNDYPGTGMGGGIYSTGTLTITNSTLSGNTVSNSIPSTNRYEPANGIEGGALGGAVYCSGTLVMANDTVSGNVTNGVDAAQYGIASGGEGAGGGIYATNTLTITGSMITGNAANGGNGQFSYESGTSGNASGGGVYSAGATTISASIIKGNSAFGGQCGFDSGGSGGASGGGIYVGSTLNISNSTITTNSAVAIGDYNGDESAGGGIYVAGAASILQSTVSDNTLTGSVPSWSEAPGATAAGGGVYAGGAVNIVQSSITGNVETCEVPFNQNGGISIGGGLDANAGGTILESTISGNSASGGTGYGNGFTFDYVAQPGGNASGGGIYSGGMMTITQSTVANNLAEGGNAGNTGMDNFGQQAGNASGGAIYGTADLSIVDSTITGNSATGGVGGNGRYIGGNGGDGTAGAISSTGTLLSIADSTITGNTSKGGTGGKHYATQTAYNYTMPGSPGTATAGGVDALGYLTLITNSIISANKAGSNFNDIAGTISLTSSNNLIGIGGGLTNGIYGNKIGITNPDLSPLGNFGGPTQTMVPLAGSPAIGGGNVSFIPVGVTTDQRGYARITGKSLDIGATQFGNAVITGAVFNDEYATGKRQTGDQGLSGWTVYLDLNHNGQFDSGDISAVTNSNGTYSFSDVPAGMYAVNILAQHAYRLTVPAMLPANVVVKAGAIVAGPAIAETQDALISGIVINSKTNKPLAGFRVFIDLNNDGKWESAEPSVVTSSNGTWSFNIASPGTYQVRIMPMPNYKTTAPTGSVFTFVVGKASARIANVFSEQPIG